MDWVLMGYASIELAGGEKGVQTSAQRHSDIDPSLRHARSSFCLRLSIRALSVSPFFLSAHNGEASLPLCSCGSCASRCCQKSAHQEKCKALAHAGLHWSTMAYTWNPGKKKIQSARVARTCQRARAQITLLANYFYKSSDPFFDPWC